MNPQVRDLLGDGSGFPAFDEMTPAEARRTVAEVAQRPRPSVGLDIDDLSIDADDGHAIGLRVYRSHHRTEPGRGLLYFHGGGWVLGDLDSDDDTCRELSLRSATTVVSVDYRLAPEHPFPAAVDDAWTALTWLRAHADDVGIDPSRLSVGGASAGGNLAAITTQMARDLPGPALRSQILLYPVLGSPDDGRPSYEENANGYGLTAKAMRWFIGHYLDGVGPVDDERFSPIRTAYLAGLPPALVITAELDVLRDEGEEYAERLRDAGVPAELIRYAGQIHGFIVMRGFLDDADSALDVVAGYLAKS